MQFEKASCTPRDIAQIASLYPSGKHISSEDVSGVPNTTFKVRTENRRFMIRIYGKGQSSLEHINLEHKLLHFLEEKMFPSPRLIIGIDGKALQIWNGFYVCAFSYINGTTADRIKITTDIAYSVGAVVALFRKVVAGFPADAIPKRENLFERGKFAFDSVQDALQQKSWKFDLAVVEEQRKNAQKELNVGVQYDGLLHADTWPPNVICDAERVVGILDFDDCCYGPAIVDIAIPLQEFVIFQDAAMRNSLAVAFFSGFVDSNGVLPRAHLRLFVPAMEFMCAVWFAYNIIQSPLKEDAELYFNRLKLLKGGKYRKELTDFINKAFRVANENENCN